MNGITAAFFLGRHSAKVEHNRWHECPFLVALQTRHYGQHVGLNVFLRELQYSTRALPAQKFIHFEGV